MPLIGEEFEIRYPTDWVERWQADSRALVDHWLGEFPHEFVGITPSANPGTQDLLAQYALMYQLRKRHGISSATWLNIANLSHASVNRARSLKNWAIMSYWMGRDRFDALQQALVAAGFTGIKGEPDLFCWQPETGEWFFAEAKGKDKIHESQVAWVELCRRVLGDDVDIRVYRVVPE